MRSGIYSSLLKLSITLPFKTSDISKTADQISHYQGVVPDWFNAGIKALLLAPSALNRQPYIVSGVGNKVSFKVKSGTLSQVDLGIGKYFFELGAGKENFEWSSYDTN